MIVPEYTAGEWAAVVRPGFVALLGPQVAGSIVRAVWDAARGGVLDVLAVVARDGLGSLPPFALVAAAPTGVHVALRGGVEVVLDGEVLAAGAVSTWTERVVDGVASVEIRVAGAAVDGPGLPVADGVVWAGSVRVVLAAAPDEPAGTSDEAGVDAETAAPAEATEPAQIAAPGPGAWPGVVDEPVPVAVRSGTGDPAPALDPPEPAQAPFGASAVPLVPLEPAVPVEPAVSVEPAVPLEPATPGAQDDDHDGLTILSSDLVAIRDQLPAWAAEDAPSPLRVAQPPAAPTRIVLSTGIAVDLDRAVLVGRAPQVSRVANSELPHLVAVPSPQQDISRTHAEVRAEGGLVLVTDLDSTNGVHVSRPGEGARRLHPGEPTVVEPGEVVDLGDGVTFVVERSA